MTLNILKLYIISTLIFFASDKFFAQQSNLSKAVNHISEFIASEKFIEIRNNYNDLASTDSLYNEALKITNGNISDALFALMFATVPYREVPIQIPILGFKVYYPLISADEQTFLKKNENLPRYLFFDTPQNDYGDKDKLAHFFGSAYLSYESSIFDLGKLIGYFVEVFEESFYIQSGIDARDLDVNDYGRLFGTLLKDNKTFKPSQILLLRSLKFFRVQI